MSAGITVRIDGGEIEREIHRLTASIALANVEASALIERELQHGKQVAKKNIQQYVYARAQGPNTRYKRTYKLLNAVRTGTLSRAGGIRAGQVYISREPFTKIYYPVFVEHGFDAGAPYEGRGYWAATVAEVRAGFHSKAALLGNRVARKMVK